jgi:S1-C subfamily serine protease
MTNAAGMKILAIGLGCALSGLVGGLVATSLSPRTDAAGNRGVEPIVRIVRAEASTPGLADMVDKACPAIVTIVGTQPADPGPASIRAGRSTNRNGKPPVTAGIIVSADGQILTIGKGLPADGTVTVLTNDGQRLDATRGPVDEASGLALIKIDARDLATLDFDDPGFPRIGDWGIGLASLNGAGCTASPAMISSDFIADGATQQSYVRVSPGGEAQIQGAPFLSPDGRIVGIFGLANGSVSGKVGKGQIPTQAPGRLIPAGAAARIASELLRTGAFPHDRFGIQIGDVTPVLAARLGDVRQQGPFISLVEAGSPAERAGLAAGDVVLLVDGNPVSSASELARALDTDSLNVTLSVLRRQKKLDLAIAAQKAPASKP